MRNPIVELLRGIAAFCIVGVHVVFPERTSAAWLLHDYCDVGVALFAALSGYFMPHGRSVDWKVYCTNRARRLLVPYAIWSCVFLVTSIGSQWLGGGIKEKFVQIPFWLTVVFEGNSSTHLWFLIWLFYMQVLFIKPLTYLPALAPALLGVAGIGIGTSFTNYYVDYPLRLLSFMLVGYAIRSLKDKSRELAFNIYSAIVVVVGLALFGLLHNHVAIGWLNLLVVLTTVMPIVCAKPRVLSSKAEMLSTLLGSVSMGIYLVHPLFSVSISKMVARFYASPYGLLPVVLAWVAAYVLSIGVILFYRRLFKR